MSVPSTTSGALPGPRPVGGDVPDWVEGFRRLRGRPPRVLHIGNIANNAYLNARILETRGVACDVACYDYYHIMGFPEWEDAEVGPIRGSHFHPHWTARELHGFERPRWFAQGPEDLVLLYLAARAGGRRTRARVLWKALEAYRAARVLGAPPEAAPVPAPSAAVAGAARPGRARRLATRLRAAVVTRATDRVRGAMRRMLERSAPSRPGVALGERFALRFPDRPPPAPEETTCWAGRARLWAGVLEHYDAVIGYATDGILPLLAGKRPYFAYEHGTIRSLPFEETPAGRTCALAYVEADEVFITNCDNEQAARRLGVQRYRFVPHPVNERVPEALEQRAQALRERLCSELGCRFLVFHPSRHHWEPRRDPSWEKGNDVLIRGLASFVESVDRDAGAVFVAWGHTLEQTRRLLDELGIADRVRWVDPLPHLQMVEYIRASDVVADQFHLGAFGSTTPKALLHERPAMLHLDPERHHWCFDELPPVLNVRTPEGVHRELERLYRDPEAARRIGLEGRGWYQRQHSGDRIARALLDAIGRGIDEHKVGVAP